MVEDRELGGARRRVPEHWHERRVGPMHILHDPLLEWSESVAGDCAFLGLVLDPYEATGDGNVIAAAVARSARLGRDGLAAALEPLAGRFVGFVATADLCVVIPDATASKVVACGVSQSVDGPTIVVSSHPPLAGELLGRRPSSTASYLIDHESYVTSRTKCLPGRMTSHEGILLVPGNQVLEWPSGRLRRVFPRTERVAGRLDDTADEIAHVLRTQTDLVVPGRRTCVSLTAGIDSRSTLAAARRRVDECSFFTVRTSTGRHDIDVQVASGLAERFGLDHDVLDTATIDPLDRGFERFLEDRAADLGSGHGKFEWTWLLANSRFRDGLQIRSNLAEIGRGFYRDRPHDRPSADALAAKWGPNGTGELPESLASFDEFITATRFDDVSAMGWDFYDLFYWEHRMSSWHGMQLLDSDLALDSFSPFNCRRLLAGMLGLSREERWEGLALRSAADRMWPEVFVAPINPPAMPGPPITAFRPVVPPGTIRAGRWDKSAESDLRPDGLTCIIEPHTETDRSSVYGGCRVRIPDDSWATFLDVEVDDPTAVLDLYVSAERDGQRGAYHRLPDVASRGERRFSEWLVPGRRIGRWVPSDYGIPESAPTSFDRLEIFARLTGDRPVELTVHRVETAPAEAT